MTASRYRWSGVSSPCPRRSCGQPRIVAPSIFDPAVPMGLHPTDEPTAPAGGWRCAAGHEGWIPSGEVERLPRRPLATFETLDELAEYAEGDTPARGALAVADGLDDHRGHRDTTSTADGGGGGK